MNFCRKCGNKLEPNNKFCKVCGTRVQQDEEIKTANIAGADVKNEVKTADIPKSPENVDTKSNKKFCRSCGAEHEDNSKFCRICGASLETPETNPNPNSNQNINQFQGSNQKRNLNQQAAQGGYFNPQNNTNGGPQFQNTQPGNQGFNPNSGYTYGFNQQSPKKSSKALVIIVSSIAAVLVVAVIVLAVLFIPKLNDTSSLIDTSASNSSSQEESHITVTEPVTEAPTQPPTEPPTEPLTAAETPKALTNTKHYDQYISVESHGTSADLKLYEWTSGGWKMLMSTYATVGKNGVGYNYGEGKSVTPKGEYSIGFCYGLTKPSTNLEFKQVTYGSVFVSDSSSPYYNCLVTRNEYNGINAENTYKQFAQDYTYNYNIFIEHNGDGETPNGATPYMGSVITICGYTGTLKPTLGCIDISSNDMTRLLSYLDSSKNPVIIIS